MSYIYVLGNLVQVSLGPAHYLRGLVGTITSRDTDSLGRCSYRVQFYEEIAAPDGSLLSSEEFLEVTLTLYPDRLLSARALETHQSIQKRVGYLRQNEVSASTEESSSKEAICVCARLVYGHSDGSPYILSKRQ